MASIFKSLSPNDSSIIPFPAYYKHSYSYTSGSPSNPIEMNISYAEKYFSSDYDELRLPNIKYDLFNSIKQTFYADLPYVTYVTSPKSFIPDEAAYVVSIPQKVFGEKILPGSFSVKFNTSQSYDDGRGNLILSSSGTGSVIGRVFYDKGIALLKAQKYANLNPDPQWTDDYPNTAWQHQLDRKLASELTSKDGVFHLFPGSDTYAAKIATRSGLFITGSNFYTRPVTPGEKYRVSGWVYAQGTTWRGIQNGGALGSDLPLGYIMVYTKNDSSIDYEFVVTPNYYLKETPEYYGTIGWQEVSKEFIIPSGVVSMSIGAFIDGKYPAGFEYGEPVCTQDEALRGCPGYAWFAGLKVNKINTPVYATTTPGMTNSGIFIDSKSIVDVSFSSSVKYYENTFKVTLEPTEFLMSPNNPTTKLLMSASTKRPMDLMISGTLLPYVTTIGFYNSNKELLLVAKTSVPVQRTKDVPQTFVVKFDI